MPRPTSSSPNPRGLGAENTFALASARQAASSGLRMGGSARAGPVPAIKTKLKTAAAPQNMALLEGILCIVFALSP